MGCGAINKTDKPIKIHQNYKITQNICKNLSTQIWQCEQNGTKKKYLVKVFKNIFINQHTQKMYINFQSEIQRLRQLAQSNQNSPKILDNDKNYSQKFVHYIKADKDANSNLILIMKYIENKSLGDYVKGKLPGILKQPQIAQYTQQILQSIKWLRSKSKIICCNIKPSNVFFSDSSKKHVIIGDYYNLQEYFSLQKPSYNKDPIYASPQNVILKQYFKETDVWRVGCFILEMLTCIKPWYQETMDFNKILSNLRNQKRPTLPQKISVNCKDFLEKCFQTDHNRRKSLEQLLRHPFITQSSGSEKKINARNTGSIVKIPPTENNKKDQFSSKNKIQIENLDQDEAQHSEIRSRKYTEHSLQKQKIQIANQSPTTTVIRKKYMMRKRLKSNQNNTLTGSIQKSDNYSKLIQNYASNSIISIESNQKFLMPIKKSQNKVNYSKRLKTQNNISNSYHKSPVKPYSMSIKNQKEEILNLLNRSRVQEEQNNKFKIKTVQSRSKSKKKISSNKITLNNQVLDNRSSHKKYNLEDNYEESQKSVLQIMQEIQAEGGDKYYKKPLRLLKKKLKDKYTLRTETSITLEDSRMLQENDQIQQINFESQNGMLSNESIHLLTEQSKISYNTHEEQVIETMVSKAEKNRYLNEQRILREQRENEKMKWKRELEEGRQLIKNQLKNKYYFSKGLIKFTNQGRIIQ